MITTLIPLPVAMPLLMAAFIALMRYLGVSANRLAAPWCLARSDSHVNVIHLVFSFPWSGFCTFFLVKPRVYKSWLLEPPPGLKTNM